MYAFFEFKIKVRLRQSAWHGYQWCVRTIISVSKQSIHTSNKSFFNVIGAFRQGEEGS